LIFSGTLSQQQKANTGIKDTEVKRKGIATLCPFFLFYSEAVITLIKNKMLCLTQAK
jgi:hypothetical protein